MTDVRLDPTSSSSRRMVNTFTLFQNLFLVSKKEPNPTFPISASIGFSSDILLLFIYLSALKSGAVERTHHFISSTRALLLVAFPYRVTLVVFPDVMSVQVVAVLALLAAICLLKISGISLPRPPRSDVFQQLYWWRVLGALSLVLILADMLRSWWDAADVLSYVTLPCWIIVDMLLLFFYAAAMHVGAFVGAPSGGGSLVAVALSYRVVALLAVPPLDLWVVSVFGVMIGTCVMAIYS